MYEFTDQQLSILNAEENYIAVEASAASSKTATLTEKVRLTLRAGVEPSTIAVITYTRMAAEELRERLADDYKDGIFIGTIHGLAARFMSLNGKGELIKKYAEDESFDEMFKECENFNISGVYNYVFLDEAQDVCAGELTFIFDMLKPAHAMVVYDLKQSIYGFKGARPDLLVEYLSKLKFYYYPLTKNFRNGRRILQFAKAIIARKGINDRSEPMREIDGMFVESYFDKDTMVNLIRKTDTFGDWAILTRDNNQLRKIAKILDINGISYVTFKQSQLTKAQLEKKMNSNTVKLITIHSSKGLGFKNVMVLGARWYGDEVYVTYVAATRAKDRLVWFKGSVK